MVVAPSHPTPVHEPSSKRWENTGGGVEGMELVKEPSMGYAIKNVITEQELDRALAFERSIFGDSQHMKLAEYSKENWLRRMTSFSDLMLYAEANGEVVAIAFGRVEAGGNITVGPVATAPGFRKQGLASEMLALLETRARERGVCNLTLGAVQGAEGFYIKCGYTPFLFVQTKPPHTLDALRALNTKYREVWNYDNGTDIRLMIETNRIDRELQHAYDAAFPGCSTQTVFMKSI
ncbi:MAG: GNAT family N-acetyltransferase [Bacillota bacterium]